MNADIISLQAIGCRKGNGETTAGTADERRYTQIEEAAETAKKRDNRNGRYTRIEETAETAEAARITQRNRRETGAHREKSR
jgi:hypothetical protein